MAEYAQVQFNVFWSPKDPDRFSIGSGDHRFTDEDGAHPGLRFAVHASPKSADYNPLQFNRLARYFAAMGWDGPAEIPVRSRKIRDRWAMIFDMAKKE